MQPGIGKFRRVGATTAPKWLLPRRATTKTTPCARRDLRLLALLYSGRHSDTALILGGKTTPDCQQLLLGVMGLILQIAMPPGTKGQRTGINWGLVSFHSSLGNGSLLPERHIWSRWGFSSGSSPRQPGGSRPASSCCSQALPLPFPFAQPTGRQNAPLGPNPARPTSAHAQIPPGCWNHALSPCLAQLGTEHCPRCPNTVWAGDTWYPGVCGGVSETQENRMWGAGVHSTSKE